MDGPIPEATALAGIADDRPDPDRSVPATEYVGIVGRRPRQDLRARVHHAVLGFDICLAHAARTHSGSAMAFGCAGDCRTRVRTRTLADAYVAVQQDTRRH